MRLFWTSRHNLILIFYSKYIYIISKLCIRISSNDSYLSFYINFFTWIITIAIINSLILFQLVSDCLFFLQSKVSSVVFPALHWKGFFFPLFSLSGHPAFKHAYEAIFFLMACILLCSRTFRTLSSSAEIKFVILFDFLKFI